MSYLPQSVPPEQPILIHPGNRSPAPYEIDWRLAYKRRELMAAKGGPATKYFLKPEIDHILDIAKDDRSKHFLINTLWHTGARISEALAVTKSDFILDQDGCFIRLPTLKRKTTKGRLVPVTDKLYLDEIRMNLGDLPKSGKTRIWTITRGTLNLYLSAVAKKADINKIHPHMFRHSFAINAILHLTPLPVLKNWMGHSSINSTSIYTEILEPDTMVFMGRIRF